MKKPKCGCKHCIAMKMWRNPNHPEWERMFWQSIEGHGRYERSPNWWQRGNFDDITQFRAGMNNKMYKRKHL